MEILLSIVLIIFGILQLVLFFKIWKMTDDVSQIKDLLERSNRTKKHIQKINNQKEVEKTKIQSECNGIAETIPSSAIASGDINLYEWVVEIESKKEFQVMEIYENGSMLCVNAEYPDGIMLERFEVEK